MVQWQSNKAIPDNSYAFSYLKLNLSLKTVYLDHLEIELSIQIERYYMLIPSIKKNITVNTI